MTELKYNEEILQATKQHTAAVRSINLRYSSKHNPYNIGDVVTDHYHTIKIDKIKYGYMSDKFPSCIYYGKGLTKMGHFLKNRLVQFIKSILNKILWKILNINKFK